MLKKSIHLNGVGTVGVIAVCLAFFSEFALAGNITIINGSHRAIEIYLDDNYAGCVSGAISGKRKKCDQGSSTHISFTSSPLLSLGHGSNDLILRSDGTCVVEPHDRSSILTYLSPPDEQVLQALTIHYTQRKGDYGQISAQVSCVYETVNGKTNSD